MTVFDGIFDGNPDRLQDVFAHIFKSIGPVSRKLTAKMNFSLFQKRQKTHTCETFILPTMGIMDFLHILDSASNTR